LCALVEPLLELGLVVLAHLLLVLQVEPVLVVESGERLLVPDAAVLVLLSDQHLACTVLLFVVGSVHAPLVLTLLLVLHKKYVQALLHILDLLSDHLLRICESLLMELHFLKHEVSPPLQVLIVFGKDTLLKQKLKLLFCENLLLDVFSVARHVLNSLRLRPFMGLLRLNHRLQVLHHPRLNCVRYQPDSAFAFLVEVLVANASEPRVKTGLLKRLSSPLEQLLMINEQELAGALALLSQRPILIINPVVLKPHALVLTS